jgi:hypothetical protein
MINVGGEQIGLHDPTSRVAKKLAHCVDPQSNIQPYKWSIMMQMEKGTLEAVMYAYATAYYTWIRRGGVQVVNQYVANTEARFTYTDVRVIRKVQMASVESMRMLCKQPLDQ